MLQTSLLLMKSLSKTETPIFLSVVCCLFPKAFFLTFTVIVNMIFHYKINIKVKRKVQGVPQSQTAALPRPQEEEETDKSKQAQTEQTYEKH